MTESSAPPEPQKGHPPGLRVLFFAEMWERFCFYGMRALLKLYMINTVVLASVAKDDKERMASLVYGSYLALIYAAAIVGGIVADRVLGYRRAIITGGLVMALGEFLLFVPQEQFFYIGLATIVVGNGMFKPNISAIVGKLYAKDDPRRDSGFTIFYMGINLGALLAPLACGAVHKWVEHLSGSEMLGRRCGFGLAGLGLLVGVFVFWRGMHVLEGKGLPPPERTNGKRDILMVLTGAVLCVPVATLLLQYKEVLQWTLYATLLALFGYLLKIGFAGGKVQRDRMVALVILLTMNVVFWACFEQAGNSFTSYTETNVDRHVLGWVMPTEWFQSWNAAFIVLLAPLFTVLWLKLHRLGMNPPAPTKFTIGLIGVGLGFGILVLGTKLQNNSGLVPLTWITLCYLVHTLAELCLSPVGLSTMTKLAPEKSSGLVMGGWFLSTGVGNYIGGWISSLAGDVSKQGTAAETLPIYTGVFWQVFLITTALGLLLLVISPLFNRLMHGIK
jgi:POT family proton-dependent oligopeptide transporter